MIEMVANLYLMMSGCTTVEHFTEIHPNEDNNT